MAMRVSRGDSVLELVVRFAKWFMALPFHDSVERRIDGFPFGQKLFQDLFAFGGERIEALVALFFFTPFANQQALGLQAAEQGVEGAFVDGHAMLGEGFTEGVAVLLGAELGEHGEDERAAAKFEPEVLEGIVVCGGCGSHAVCHLLCGIHCAIYTVCHTV
jgi:hypothetical protein